MDVPLKDSSMLYYSNDDDGVWLSCTLCDFDANLGFSASLTDAAKEWAKHECTGRPS